MHHRACVRIGLLFLASLCATVCHAKIPKLRDLPVVATPVYPYDALIQKREGMAVLECILNTKGQLVDISVVSSDGSDFSGAALAYADVRNYASDVEQMRPGEEFIKINLRIFFRETKDWAMYQSPAAPTESAMWFVRKLRRDPTGKFLTPANQLDHNLEPVSQKAPVFPSLLRDKTKSGSALIEVCIDKSGDVILPRIISATDPAFGYAACQGISEWKFKPPLKKGRQTVTRVRIPVDFDLKATAE